MEPRDRGTLVHAILEATYRRLAEAGAFPLTRERLPAALEVFQAVFDDACGEAERRGVTGLPALWAGERARLHAELLSALEAEADDAAGQDPAWIPARFEAAFGVEWREGAGPPLAYRLADGTEIRLCGTIDRIDLSPDERHARVLDYKTGRVRTPRTPDRLGRGRALQLPIYRLAAEAMLLAGGRDIGGRRGAVLPRDRARRRNAHPLHAGWLGDPPRGLRPRAPARSSTASVPAASSSGRARARRGARAPSISRAGPSAPGGPTPSGPIPR